MNDIEELTQKKLKKLLHYDPMSGIFTWLERTIEMFGHCQDPDHQCNAWNAKNANQEAGNIWTSKNRKTSYLIISITLNGKEKKYKAHRLAILYTARCFPPKDVDHIDGNGLNNRRDNLRLVTNQENSKNRPMQSNNTSGYTGIYWNKAAQKWRVLVRINGKGIHGGYFVDKEDAIARRKKMEIEYNFHINHGREKEN